MKTVRYICSHCGRRFEAEEKETLECPGCYWSTSVKKEDAHDAQKSSENQPPLSRQGLGPLHPRKIPNLIPVLMVVAIILSGVALWFRFQGLLKHPSELPEIKIKGTKEQKPAKGKKQELPASPLDLLSEEEKAILKGRIELTPDRKPSEEETKILEFHAPFQTGTVEKLPSQAWTLANFKEMIAGQEKVYKVPLPGSYKSKLEKLFQEKYAPGTAAFEAGDLQKARDFWVESLAFPIYANNIQKHRGVVLTMLRAFINDTLSKVGAINNILSERNVREQERKVSEQYQALFTLIQNHSWTEALAAITRLEGDLTHLEKPSAQDMAPPPYPDAVKLVDEGIRATLFELLTPPPAGFADVTPLHQDLRTKRAIVISFIPEYGNKAQARYDHAVQLIQQEQWPDAEEELRQVDIPMQLVKDAQEKIKILEKLKKAGLDSGSKSS